MVASFCVSGWLWPTPICNTTCRAGRGQVGAYGGGEAAGGRRLPPLAAAAALWHCYDQCGNYVGY